MATPPKAVWRGLRVKFGEAGGDQVPLGKYFEARFHKGVIKYSPVRVSEIRVHPGPIQSEGLAPNSTCRSLSPRDQLVLNRLGRFLLSRSWPRSTKAHIELQKVGCQSFSTPGGGNVTAGYSGMFPKVACPIWICYR